MIDYLGFFYFSSRFGSNIGSTELISQDPFLHHAPKAFRVQAALAEGEGFEPPEPVKVQRFSRPPVSATHPPLRMRTGALWIG